MHYIVTIKRLILHFFLYGGNYPPWRKFSGFDTDQLGCTLIVEKNMGNNLRWPRCSRIFFLEKYFLISEFPQISFSCLQMCIKNDNQQSELITMVDFNFYKKKCSHPRRCYTQADGVRCDRSPRSGLGEIFSTWNVPIQKFNYDS